jgi:hypothetical protein
VIVAPPSCPVRLVGKRIVDGTGQTTYRYPGSEVPVAQIRCSGRVVWVLLHGGAASSQEMYLGLRSADGGRTWKLLLSEPYFGIKAPFTIDAYSGPWTIVGENAAYFVGWCPACTNGNVVLVATTDGGRTFHRYAVPSLSGYGQGLRSVSVNGDTVTIATRGRTATVHA